jgi:hypothetical protein
MDVHAESVPLDASRIPFVRPIGQPFARAVHGERHSFEPGFQCGSQPTVVQTIQGAIAPPHSVDGSTMPAVVVHVAGELIEGQAVTGLRADASLAESDLLRAYQRGLPQSLLVPRQLLRRQPLPVWVTEIGQGHLAHADFA